MFVCLFNCLFVCWFACILAQFMCVFIYKNKVDTEGEEMNSRFFKAIPYFFAKWKMIPKCVGGFRGLLRAFRNHHSIQDSHFLYIYSSSKTTLVVTEKDECTVPFFSSHARRAQTRTQARTSTPTHVHTYSCTHIHMHTYAYPYTYIRISIYAYPHILCIRCLQLHIHIILYEHYIHSWKRTSLAWEKRRIFFLINYISKCLLYFVILLW